MHSSLKWPFWVAIWGTLLLSLAACVPADPPSPATPLLTPTFTPTPFLPISPTPRALAILPSPSPVAPVPSPIIQPSPTILPTLDPSWHPTPIPPLDQYESIRFLLLGSDRRPGSTFRTDAIIVVTFWPRQHQVSLLSIPRDLWVSIPTWGMQRINTAYQHGELNGYPGGGAALMKDTLRENLGITIDHVALVEFDGFKRIIDILGGIDVPVACPYTDWRLIDPSLDPENEQNWQLYTVGPGYVHMDGDLALWYARSRKRSSDFDRGRRQQEVLRAIYARLIQADLVTHLPALYQQLSGMIATDLTLSDLLKLSFYAPQLGNANVRSYYIRPPYVIPTIGDGGAYLLLPNAPLLNELLAEALTPAFNLPERERLVVQVENGTPWRGWEMLVTARLNYAGFQTHIVPIERHDVLQTLLIDLTPNQDPQARQILLQALGLDPSRLLAQPTNAAPIAYRLIIGQDYQPCFEPQNLP